jgi:hypothetical protein
MLLVLALSDTGETADSRPTFSGRNVIKGGTGERSGLSGVLQFQGTVDLATGLSASDYSGEIQFHP